MIKNERGFTIMELMVVIVIIGVLAAIGVPAYKSMTDRARKQACLANQRTISSAVAMYYAEHGSYVEFDDTTVAEANPYMAYVDNIDTIKCPSKTSTDSGGYEVDAEGNVTCTVDSANHKRD